MDIRIGASWAHTYQNLQSRIHPLVDDLRAIQKRLLFGPYRYYALILAFALALSFASLGYDQALVSSRRQLNLSFQNMYRWTEAVGKLQGFNEVTDPEDLHAATTGIPQRLDEDWAIWLSEDLERFAVFDPERKFYRVFKHLCGGLKPAKRKWTPLGPGLDGLNELTLRLEGLPQRECESSHQKTSKKPKTAKSKRHPMEIFY